LKVQYVVTVDVNHPTLLRQVAADIVEVQYVTSVHQKSNSVIDNNPKRVVAVDFDLTICESDYPDCGPAKKGAKKALQALRDMGFLILIYSCRTCHWHFDQFQQSQDTPVMQRDPVRKMAAWLHANQMPFDEIDDGTRGKPYADFYVDDKGVRFNNNWPEIVEFIGLKSGQQGLFD
jgi:hypothetical protein